MKKKKDLKYWIGRLHLWLGLITGLIVFIVSITGCLFVFHDEIKDVTRAHRFVVQQDKPFLPPSVLAQNALKQVPDNKPSFIVYQGRNRSAGVYCSGKAGTLYVYFDPYTGKYLATENLEKDFFIIVEYIHLYLLLPPDIGRHIIGISVIIFVIQLITGLVMWWPRRKHDRKMSFTIKWKSRWRRLNYDLHKVLGFYAAGIALVLAITGLAIDYDWMRKAMYHTANVASNYNKDEDAAPIIDSVNAVESAMPAMDIAFEQTQQLSPKGEMYFITFSSGKADPITTGAYAKALNYDHQDNYYFDPASGKIVKSFPHSKKSAGMRFNEMNYGLHVGQYFGLAGKIIAFIISLICASLPITGFLLWYGRKWKKKPSVKKVEITEDLVSH